MKRKLRALNTFYWPKPPPPPHTQHTLPVDLTTNLKKKGGMENLVIRIKTVAMNFYNRQTASRQMKSIESNAVNSAAIEMENVINRTRCGGKNPNLARLYVPSPLSNNQCPCSLTPIVYRLLSAIFIIVQTFSPTLAMFLGLVNTENSARRAL